MVTLFLTEYGLKELVHDLTCLLANTPSEPIPDFSQADRNRLLSALERPRQVIFGKYAYPTLPEKAAVLFYSLIKNHPFPNGNKRIASTALIIFLFGNGYKLEVRRKEIVRQARSVARSKPRNHKMIEHRIVEWLKKGMVPTSDGIEERTKKPLLKKTVENVLKIRRPRKPKS